MAANKLARNVSKIPHIRSKADLAKKKPTPQAIEKQKAIDAKANRAVRAAATSAYKAVKPIALRAGTTKAKPVAKVIKPKAVKATPKPAVVPVVKPATINKIASNPFRGSSAKANAVQYRASLLTLVGNILDLRTTEEFENGVSMFVRVTNTYSSRLWQLKNLATILNMTFKEAKDGVRWDSPKFFIWVTTSADPISRNYFTFVFVGTKSLVNKSKVAASTTIDAMYQRYLHDIANIEKPEPIDESTLLGQIKILLNQNNYSLGEVIDSVELMQEVLIVADSFQKLNISTLTFAKPSEPESVEPATPVAETKDISPTGD